MAILEEVTNSVIEGDKEAVTAAVNRALAEKLDPIKNLLQN